MKNLRSLVVAVAGFGAMLFTFDAAVAGPTPIGASTTTISYTTDGGLVSFSGDRDYSGVGPVDASQLDGAPNIRTFNSANAFGRRTFVSNQGPQFADVIRPNETAMAHAFFKIPANLSSDYFPGITSDSMITIQVDGIMFDQPVMVSDETVMLHTLFSGDQVDQLSQPYFDLHNHHISDSAFRDFDDFVSTGVFSTFPQDNFVLDSSDLVIEFTGEGTNELNVSVSFPYALLEHGEESGQSVPNGLPAPHGFLEPFHFHIEYAVTPEPATLLMLLPAAAIGMRRRRQGSAG